MKEQFDSRPPEELQDETLKLLSHLPKAFPEDATTADKAEGRLKRFSAEIIDPLQAKFSELISRSPSTDIFKEMLTALFVDTIIVGRDSDNERVTKLKEVLQLDSKNGIYDRQGALVAEQTLFEFILNKVVGEIELNLEIGQDFREKDYLKVITSRHSALEAHNALIMWYKDAAHLYEGDPGNTKFFVDETPL